MIFKKNNITISDILSNAFTFTKIDIPDEFLDHLESLEYDYIERHAKVKYSLDKIDDQTEVLFRELLSKLDVCETIKDDLSSFSFGIDRYTKGDNNNDDDEEREYDVNVVNFIPLWEKFVVSTLRRENV
jgi:hypothetical protein